jgi:hypothetical protein
MELRFAENARATKDLDVGIAGARAERLYTNPLQRMKMNGWR